jgi:DNA (cytosine-5)-methyltransferase 1
MTIDASPRYALTSAHIVKYYSGDDNYSSVKSPLHTVTVKERNALVESHLCVLRNNMDCKSMAEPLSTVTTSAGHFAKIDTKIVKYDGGQNLYHWPEVRELLNKYCDYNMADDEILLLVINGENCFICDIGMRMLVPRELYNAHGFPRDYIIDVDYKGNMYPNNKQVARCGNSVPPPLAEAMVRANLPEWCDVKIVNMAQLHNKVAYGGMR